MTYSKQLDDGTVVGNVEGVVPGTYFVDRQDLHNRKIHRGLMRGIAPHGSSVVLSGGYPDDQDDGDTIIYTGEGGRDANTNRQVTDQEFTGGNEALAENHLKGIPVRVVRGSKYVPEIPAGFRYRYDGLYRVAQSWIEVGRDGFKICRFRLERLTEADFPPIPGSAPVPGEGAPGGNRSPGRRESRVTRVIRQKPLVQ